jgi:hypothetical protein
MVGVSIAVVGNVTSVGTSVIGMDVFVGIAD